MLRTEISKRVLIHLLLRITIVDSYDSTSSGSSNRSTSRTPGKDGATSGEKETPLSTEVLSALGKRTHEEKILAPLLHAELAVEGKDVITYGLTKEERAELIKKYLTPENCLFYDPPKMNAEIKRIMPQTASARDERIISKQQIRASLAAVGKADMTLIQNGKDLVDLPVIECLNDVSKLLVDLQRDEAMIRHSLTSSNINAAHKDAIAQTVCGEFLFGEKLDDIVKSAKTLDAAAKDLRASEKTNQGSKNGNNPSRPRDNRQRRTWSGYRSEKYKKMNNQAHRQSRPGRHRDRENRHQRR